MFDRWLVAGAAPAIEAALASIAPARDGTIAVIGDARLARALASRGRAVAVGYGNASESRVHATRDVTGTQASRFGFSG